MTDSENPAKSSRGPKVVRWAWALAVLVIFIIVLLFVLHPVERFKPRSEESVLKMDLKTMRDAIDKYTLDKRKPPQSLQDMVDANYLRAIPVDPMTNQRDWRAEFDDVPIASGSAVNAIVNIHSASGSVSTLSGTPYSEW